MARRSRVACQRCNRRKVKCDVAQSCPCANCRVDGQDCVVLPRKKHRPRRKRNLAGELVENDGSRPRQKQTVEEEEDEVEDSSQTPTPDIDPSHPDAPQQARARIPPRKTAHKPHEIEYMRQQGVYSALPDDVCDDLVGCYFQHVHFFLPIVDVAAFLNEYAQNGSGGVNLLLLWSMFLASANFADLHVLQRAGFTSRKAMKTAMYERAKCLYDLDRGTDKVTLIQSVILLAFWYSDPQDHTGAWYWIGVAISLAVGAGLHRQPGRLQAPARPHLARRIWWTLLVRDRWVALAKGRPVRIYSESFDVPLPAVDDIMTELEGVTASVRRFVPAEARELTGMWLQLAQVSDVLGDVLRIHYRARGPEPPVGEIFSLAQRLRALDGTNVSFGSDLLRIHAHQTELFHRAAIAILYRPYVLSESCTLPAGADVAWQSNAVREARQAASGTNTLLQGLIELDAVKYLKPMIITAMVPSMQIHLADCKSNNTLTSGLARNKLQLCMLVLSDMRATYWNANVMYRLFERAQSLLGDKEPEATPEVQVAQPPPPVVDIVDVAPDPLWYGISPEFSNVDQLLSPGFSLSDDVFLDFFPNYHVAYGQPLPAVGESLYNLPGLG